MGFNRKITLINVLQMEPSSVDIRAGEISIECSECLSMKKLQGKTRIKNINIQHPVYFDLNATYTVSYISRLLAISPTMALRYVKQDGTLTERGIQTLHDLNKELNSIRSI